MGKINTFDDIIKQLKDLENINVISGIFKDIKNENNNAEINIINCINKCTSPVKLNINDEDSVVKNKIQTIFRVFDLFPLSETRILILGQDPYPEKGKAEGLAFSVNEDYESIDESLLNIYKAAGVNINEGTKKSLITWATNNNVLLLNTALTHENSSDETIERHIAVWNPFIIKVINNLIKYKIGAKDDKLSVFLWGEKAQNVFFQSLNELNKEEKGHYNQITSHFEEYKILNKRSKKILQFKKKNNVITGCKEVINIAFYMTYHPSKRYNKGMKIFLEQTPSNFKACDEFLGKNKKTKQYTWEIFPENNE